MPLNPPTHPLQLLSKKMDEVKEEVADIKHEVGGIKHEVGHMGKVVDGHHMELEILSLKVTSLEALMLAGVSNAQRVPSLPGYMRAWWDAIVTRVIKPALPLSYNAFFDGVLAWLGEQPR